MHTFAANSLTELELKIMEQLTRATPECRRGKKSVELRPVLTELRDPTKRVFMTPCRYNNIFAQIAETIWVLAGRDDMDFLSFYLPRAKEWSDDGITWRAAYGPRLRGWVGLDGKEFQGSAMRKVDQLKFMYDELKKDVYTRRAVAVIHDPAKDWVETKDRPCNNWLHFITSKDKLDLEVASRSTDFLWGSNINYFEWSVLHEMMAYWTGQPMGSMFFYTSSCHLYEEFLDRVSKIVYNQSMVDIYQHVPAIKFDLSKDPDETYQALETLISFEKVIRGVSQNDDCADIGISMIEEYESEWLSAWARMLWAYCRMEKKCFSAAARILNELPVSDLKVAGFEVLQRRWLKQDKKAAKSLKIITKAALGEIMSDYLEEFKDENS